jgi:hypothetical protein
MMQKSKIEEKNKKTTTNKCFQVPKASIYNLIYISMSKDPKN